MTITLNKDPLDITIEKEKYLSELVSGVSEWLNSEGYEITEITADGKNLDIYSGEWNKIPLDTVGKLNFTAVPEYEKYISDLHTLYQYITLLKESLEGNNKFLTADLLKEIPFIVSSIDLLFGKENKPAVESQQLKEMSDLYNSNEDSEEYKKLFLTLLNNISVKLQNRINEIASPLEELSKISALLEALIPKISDVSVMLQTGDDKQAMDSVLNFIELSENLIRIFHFLRNSEDMDITGKSIENESFPDFFKAFNVILSELVEAFDINDSILIGDLMEYEIVPKVVKLLDYINLIINIQE